MEQSRRRMLASTAGLLTASTLAGCLDDDEAGANGDENGTENGETATASVTFLVEGVDGHDHDDDHDDHDDHDDDHDDHDDDHDDHDDHDDEGLSHDAIDHACGHMEYDDSDPIEAGDSPEDAPVVTETHQPFDITVEGESGYVAFEVDDDHDDDHDDHDDGHDDHDDGHDDDHDDHDDHDDGHDDDHDDHEHGGGDTFAFFTRGGSVEIAEGHAGHAEANVEDCNLIDAYQIVELDHGRAVAELSVE